MRGGLEGQTEGCDCVFYCVEFVGHVGGWHTCVFGANWNTGIVYFGLLRGVVVGREYVMGVPREVRI